MQDELSHVSEYRPYWRHVDDGPFPRNAKCLWKTNRGAATIGVWYPESQWKWWCPLPSHSEADKARRSDGF